MGQVSKPISISEAYRLLQMHDVSPLDEKHQVRFSGGNSLADLLTSPIVDPLFLPDTAVLIVSPYICSRHVTPFAYQEKTARLSSDKSVFGRTWSLILEEQDIVSGDSIQKAKKTLLEMVHTMEPKPKAIVLCYTCIDMLLASDFRTVARQVEKETGVRIGITSMCVLLNDSTNNPDFMRTWNGIFELLRTEPGIPKEKSINLIGVRPFVDEKSDFLRLMEGVGYGKVNHYQHFKTLDEFDCMGQAALGVSVSSRANRACETIKKHYGIPYVTVTNTYDLDEIHSNYMKIADALGIAINDQAEYDVAKKRAQEVAELFKDKTVAVGEMIDENPFKAAKDLCILGFNVKAIFTRFVKPQYEEAICWLSENRPDIVVYYSAHPGMYYYQDSPDHYDISLGISGMYTKKDQNTIALSFDQRNPDYYSLIKFLDALEKCCTEEPAISDTEVSKSQRTFLGESGINRREWRARRRRHTQ